MLDAACWLRPLQQERKQAGERHLPGPTRCARFERRQSCGDLRARGGTARSRWLTCASGAQPRTRPRSRLRRRQKVRAVTAARSLPPPRRPLSSASARRGALTCGVVRVAAETEWLTPEELAAVEAAEAAATAAAAQADAEEEEEEEIPEALMAAIAPVMTDVGSDLDTDDEAAHDWPPPPPPPPPPTPPPAPSALMCV